ncbi:MAG: nucleoside deaminase [Lachnospiraceae bacterium]
MNFMEEAQDEAYVGIQKREGGPFGCVIVKDGKIVGRGHNRVLLKKDSTCHGEMEAIRDACKNLDTHDLSGCELYTTAEPCPMCLGAILWANIRVVYYGCNRMDTDRIGFRDDVFYDAFYKKNTLLQCIEQDREGCLRLFETYALDKENMRY